MSLSDILDDIKSDVSNIETSENIKISIENAIVTDTKNNEQQLNIQRFSKETLEKVNNMFNLLILKQNIDGMTRVDKNTALEVFTMLPEVGKVEQAKLTSAPSIINKEIIDKIFNSNIEYKISSDIFNKLYDLKILIENHIPVIETLITYFQAFNLAVKEKVERFKAIPPTIIEYRPYTSEENKPKTQMIDLYTEKIDVILRMDDSKLEYEKYNGKLIQMFYAIYHNETLNNLYKTILYLPDKNELSLANIVHLAETIIENLNRYKEDLEHYCSGIIAIDNKEAELNTETIKFVNDYEDIATKLETISRLKVITETKDNCFEKTVELVEFID